MHEPLSDHAGPPDVYVRGAPPPPPTQPLEEQRHVEVAVIGAGFTGLSAALHLAEAGVDVAVLEAKEIGWGASGRAFGQVVPYLKLGHEAILRHYGPARGQRVVDAVADGPDLVFELIGRHGIECWAMRSGLIFAAHSPSGRRDLESRTRYWQQRGAPVEMLEGARCAEAIGSRFIGRHRLTAAAATSIRSPTRAGWRMPRSPAGAASARRHTCTVSRGGTVDGRSMSAAPA